MFSFYKSLDKAFLYLGSLVGLQQGDGSCVVSNILSIGDIGDRNMRRKGEE